MENDQDFYTVRGYEILKKNQSNLTPSMEDYLEMIYRNCLTEGYIRINNLAKQLNVKASSASKVAQKLSKMTYINYEKYGIIQLTEKGKNIGEFLLTRHNTVETFLKNLGVENNVLVETELIEHHLSLDTLEKIEIFNDFALANPDIIKRLHQFEKKNEGQ
ncbi:MAG: DtxR family transcriptional regulator [Firmicutes bacterium HGW-Firmicutes-15]|nr:MAG: DtxR family transcriptional regulator [Firmicutes bacterium HGW-Firmicutes-15]